MINIGVAAHITAAAAGGPRYDGLLSVEDRRGVTNGIWLCQNCAKLVDNDENRYTIDLLRNWKTVSEGAALLDVERNAPSLATGVGTDVQREKLATYLAIGRLFGLLSKEFDLIQNWSERINEDPEIAQLSCHFPASGVINRLHDRLTDIEELRIQRRWLLAWRVDALLYAITFKGGQVRNAIVQYGAESDDWQLKRGHQLAASSVATVVSGYAFMCLKEADADVNQPLCTLSETRSDEEAKAFFKLIGDMGRAESKTFSDENPELAARLRETNRLTNERNVLDFKYKLLCERVLDPAKGTKVTLDGKQRIWFLERLYRECLAFYFRMWNDPLSDAQEEDHRSRLARLLEGQSSREICHAFTKMISSIRSTVEKSTPLARDNVEGENAIQEARLRILKPSTTAYGTLEELIELHLAELKEA